MKIAYIILIILILVGGFFIEELYRYIFLRKSSRLFSYLFDSKGHEEGYYQFRDEKKELLKREVPKVYEISSSGGKRLKGFYYDNGGEGKKIAFIIHGYRSEHLETAGMVFDYYKSRSIDVFAVDHRASGESEGELIGFDVLESEDCLSWLDFLQKELGEDIRVILHGFSMGGATVLKMSGYAPNCVKLIVSDSGYINAYESLKGQIGILYPIMRGLNKIIGGYDLNSSDVRESLKKSSLPILFVHGRDDKLVPFSNGERLFEEYEGEKDFLFPEKTRHIETMYTSPREYEEKLDSFVERYL